MDEYDSMYSNDGSSNSSDTWLTANDEKIFYDYRRWNYL